MPLRRDPPVGPPTYRRVLGCITVDLTDVENIVRVLRERAAEVQLRLGWAEADEAVDLKDATGSELQQLIISTSSPKVQIALRRNEASISALEDTVNARALVDDAFFLLSQRKSTGAVIRAVWYPIWLATWLIIVLISALLAGNSPLAALIAALLLPGFIVAGRNMRHIRASGLATVIPNTRSERRRVSQDMRHQFSIGIIIAIFGVVLTVVITTGH